MAASTTNRWKLGLFVVGSIAMAIGVLGFMGMRRMDRPYITFTTYFDEAVDGLDIGAPVKFRGIPIGSVSEILVAPNRECIEVKAKIYYDALDDVRLRDPEHPKDPGAPDFVPDNLRVELVASLLTGVAFIQTDIFDPELYPKPKYEFEPAEPPIVYSVPSVTKRLAKGLFDAIDQIPVLTDSAVKLIDKIDDNLTRAEIPELSARARQLLETADKKLAAIDTEALSRDLTGALQEIRDLAAGLRDEEQPFQKLVVRLESIVARIEEAVEGADIPATAAAIRDVALGTAALSYGIDGSLPQLRATLESIRRLADLLDRDPSALLYGRSPTPSIPRSNR